ncbi:hypothetical protein E9232_004226 [Inquilinus ginsengisoli]|uniref:Uncharacterized protein n=1 Tax=Inquilinus ginsengisoli TaxID=363840 RepID=A0ABU1JST7_9PROT|nr:hypothetical protein [Inquilinus ginsengisoli]MDR6291692.1 hypothetical protein [Inquilinus ginsengisoli]
MTAGGAALVALVLAWPAAAAVDLGNLSADDMRALQRILETERTNSPKRLPSGMAVTVVQTQTSPRVCRIFRIGRQGQEGQAVGCRIGAQRWALNASIEAARAVPADVAPADVAPNGPAARPKVVAQSRPVPSEDEGVEEAGADSTPSTPPRRGGAETGTAPAEAQVAALPPPRAPFQPPRPLDRPRSAAAPDTPVTAPTQAPVPRARPGAAGQAPVAAVAPQAPRPAVVEIDPNLRVLTTPPVAPRPLPRPGAAQPAPAVAPAPVAAAAPPPSPAVAAAPAPKPAESLISVPPAAILAPSPVEALLPRTAAPAPFAVPAPRARPMVAAAQPAAPALPVVVPGARPVPRGLSDVPVPRRRPG